MNKRNAVDSAVRDFILGLCDISKSTYASELKDAVLASRPPDFSKLTKRTTCSKAFAEDYFYSEYLSKYKGWKFKDVDPKAQALRNWFESEAKNRETNIRLRALKNNTGFPGTDLLTVISTAQVLISGLLGRLNVSTILAGSRWGPGATADHRRGTRRDRKATTQGLTTTNGCLCYMKSLIESDPNWIEAITGFYPVGQVSLTRSFFSTIEHSKWTSVPKSFKTDRGIDMQPTANGYLQQGVGQYIRSRLKRVGIDLNSQEHNKEAAFRAFFDGLATVDLQQASDSMSVELIWLLLPPDWAHFLSKLRTTYSLVEGNLIKLEKFGAMGNAFIFELETLIFWAISKACIGDEELSDSERVLVYGDDIIIPQRYFDKVVYALGYFGFQTNAKKSFSSGPFYESCGSHFFKGDDVTPVYQKETLDEPAEIVRAYNRLVRLGARLYGDPWYFDGQLVFLLALFEDSLPDHVFKKFGYPKIAMDNVSDDGFVFPPEYISRDQNGGYYTVVLRRQKSPDLSERVESYYLASKLLNPKFSNGSTKGYVYEDMGKGRYKLRRAYFYS